MDEINAWGPFALIPPPRADVKVRLIQCGTCRRTDRWRLGIYESGVPIIICKCGVGKIVVEGNGP